MSAPPRPMKAATPPVDGPCAKEVVGLIGALSSPRMTMTWTPLEQRAVALLEGARRRISLFSVLVQLGAAGSALFTRLVGWIFTSPVSTPVCWFTKELGPKKYGRLGATR